MSVFHGLSAGNVGHEPDGTLVVVVGGAVVVVVGAVVVVVGWTVVVVVDGVVVVVVVGFGPLTLVVVVVGGFRAAVADVDVVS